MSTWVVLDVSGLLYRSLYSMGHLEHKGIKTGVIYGFLKDAMDLVERFDTNRLVFCFDGGYDGRRALLPTYKLKRHSKPKTPEEQASLNEMHRQMKLLRTEYLPTMGFKNVFYAKGFESDDLIADIAQNLSSVDDLVIVSEDNDLWQLISSQVKVFNAKKRKLITLQTFYAEHGIRPHQWARVKATAGCSTDEVPGIKGIGDLTAMKFLRGELKLDSKPYQAIVSNEGKTIIKRNRPLVQLPFEGTPACLLQDDDLSEDGWNTVIEKLGIKSLRDKGLFGYRQMRRRAS